MGEEMSVGVHARVDGCPARILILLPALAACFSYIGAVRAEPLEARVTVRLLLLTTPSGVQTTTNLASLGTPVGHQSQLLPGRTVFLETWCQTPGPSPISTAVADLTYETAFFDTTPAQVSLASQWDLLAFPVAVDDAAGVVDDLGGNNLTGLGAAPDWAKIGTVAFDVARTPADRVTFCSRFAGGHLTFAILGEGVVNPNDVAYECLTVGCLIDPDCDDGNVCTDDSCDSVLGCVHGNNSVPCEDGLFCNGPETCADGSCQPGVPPGLDDGVGCTLDTCDEINDVILHTPDDARCGDGLFCNGDEFCDSLSDCQPGDGPCVDPALPQCDEVLDRCVECLGIGDVNGDGRSDLVDLSTLPDCATGPIGPVDLPAYPSACRCWDADRDGDVDLDDFSVYQVLFAP